MVWFDKVKMWILEWFLCIWIWFLLNWEAKVPFNFWTILLTPATVWLHCSWWDKLKLDWGIRTLNLSAKFKMFKDSLFHHRSRSLEWNCSSFILAVQLHIRQKQNWKKNWFLFILCIYNTHFKIQGSSAFYDFRIPRCISFI